MIILETELKMDKIGWKGKELNYELVKNDDKTSQLDITLTKNDKPYTKEELQDQAILIKFLLKSQKIVGVTRLSEDDNSGITITDEGVISAVLPRKVLSEVGKVKAEVTLVGEKTVITSEYFTFYVRKNLSLLDNTDEDTSSLLEDLINSQKELMEIVDELIKFNEDTTAEVEQILALIEEVQNMINELEQFKDDIKKLDELSEAQREITKQVKQVLEDIEKEREEIRIMLSAKSSNYVLSTEADMELITPEQGDICYLLNNKKMFIYDKEWVVINQVAWDDIQNKPSSQPIDIDKAVLNTHTHHNVDILENITRNDIDNVSKHLSDSNIHLTPLQQSLLNSIPNKVSKVEFLKALEEKANIKDIKPQIQFIRDDEDKEVGEDKIYFKLI